jgi:chromosome partitioning protein
MGVIAVFNQKGGVGKTTTALNLLARSRSAATAHSASTSTRKAHLTHIFGLQPRLAEDSIYSFFVRGRPLVRSGADHAERRRAVSRASRARQDRLAARQERQRRHEAAHRAARPKAPPGPVVIDCCPLLNVLSLNAIFACDVLLVPVSCDFLSLRGALQVERALNAPGAGVQASGCRAVTCSRATTSGAR